MSRPLYGAALFLALFGADDPDYRTLDIPVGPFALTERSGKTVTNADLDGKVWVAHFFYSQCQGPCNQTLPAMRALQQTFAGKPDVMLVSISVDPVDDTTARLSSYALDQGAEAEQWLFLTGTESAVHETVRKSFFNAVDRNANATTPGTAFDHSSRLLVIDRHGIIDGYVDGTAPNAAEVAARHVRRVAARKYMLPAVNAALNGLCAVLLVAGYVAIRRRRETLHRNLMFVALAVSAVFLTCYLYFHFVVQAGRPTAFRGEGWVRTAYFAILLTHTVLAALVAPLALFVAYQGLRDRRRQHVRVARWTLPIWLYVSITGVVVYWLLYQVYPPY